jgi:hypothetical protein
MLAQTLAHTIDQYAYARDLPGGGFVAIDIERDRTWLGARRFHGTLAVERRANPNRRDGPLPVIGEAFGRTAESVLQQLLPTAQSNCAIGTALLRQGVAFV